VITYLLYGRLPRWDQPLIAVSVLKTLCKPSLRVKKSLKRVSTGSFERKPPQGPDPTWASAHKVSHRRVAAVGRVDGIWVLSVARAARTKRRLRLLTCLIDTSTQQAE
jgi:hypothetical protein